MSHGRIAEICEDRVESLYSREIPLGLRGDAQEGRDDTTSAAFFGIVRAGDNLLAAGVDGLYRIGPGGLVDFARFPTFHRIRGVHLNFDEPDVILVVTQINRRASVSGGAPMLIPR